jgi:hypothetical protein
MRRLRTHALRGEAVLAALILVAAGALALGTTGVHAQMLSPGSAHLSVLSVPTVSGAAGTTPGCTDGDSWCAYCANNSGSELCSQFEPAKASGNASVGGQNNSGNTPVLGVEAGGPMIPGIFYPGSTAAATAISMTSASSSLRVPAGASWQWCGLIGGGAAWVPAGTSSPNLVC